MTKTIAPARWYRLLPVVFITYSLAYLDRANFGFGTAGGMAEDLHITPVMSSLLGSLFFLGYFVFQIPGVHYAANKSTKKLIFWSLIFWGIFATLTGMVSDVRFLVVIRFMLGVVESAIFPSMLLLLNRWFTRTERSRANTYLIFGNPVTVLWMSVVSGYLIDALGWRWMFIIEGVPAIVWAAFWWLLVQDRPADAKWLTLKEKDLLREELQKEQQAIKPVKNYLAAFKSKAVLLLSVQYAMWCLGVYGFVLWLPTIIKSAPHMDIVKTGWLSAIPYFVAIIGMIAVSHFSDKTLRRKVFVWAPLFIASLAFFGSWAAGSANFWLSFSLLSLAGVAMYVPYGPFFALITEILPANVAGASIALINSFGALGSFAGAYLVGYLNAATGSFAASYIFLSVSLLLAAALTYVALNDARKRSLQYAGAVEHEA